MGGSHERVRRRRGTFGAAKHRGRVMRRPEVPTRAAEDRADRRAARGRAEAVRRRRVRVNGRQGDRQDGDGPSGCRVAQSEGRRG